MTSQEPKTPQFADHDIPDTEVIVVSAPAPVFVDSTGRRRKVFRRLAYAFGALCMLYGGLVSVSLAGGPVSSSAVLPLPDLHGDDEIVEARPRPTPIPTVTTAPQTRFLTEALRRPVSNRDRADVRRSPAATPARTPTPAPTAGTPSPRATTGKPVESATTKPTPSPTASGTPSPSPSTSTPAPEPPPNVPPVPPVPPQSGGTGGGTGSGGSGAGTTGGSGSSGSGSSGSGSSGSGSSGSGSSGSGSSGSGSGSSGSGSGSSGSGSGSGTRVDEPATPVVDAPPADSVDGSPSAAGGAEAVA